MDGESPTDAPVDPGLVERCHGNMVEAFRRVARGLPEGRVEERHGLVLVGSGWPGTGFNVAFVTRVPSDPAATVERVGRFMAEAGIPSWRIVTFPEATGAVRELAAPAGLGPPRSVPALVLHPIPVRTPPPPAGLRTRRATTPKLWERFVCAGFEGFGATAAVDPERILPYESWRDARAYLGFVGRDPVATSLGFVHAGISGVYFVATLPAHRRKGYGAAMTWRAAVGGRAEGCRVSCLQATEMGLPVYRAMGDRPFAEYGEFLGGEAAKEAPASTGGPGPAG